MRLEDDKDFLVCDYCGNIHAGETSEEGVRVLGENAPSNCPVCSIAMVHAAVDAQRILYCKRCRGMLVRMDIFLSLVEDLRSKRDMAAQIVFPVNAKDLGRSIPCPRCCQDMDSHVYGGGGNAVIGSCERCEVNWLDHGALDRIVRAPDRMYSTGD
jgi:Zn-finger nucleic acid-binding protein